MTKRKKIGLSPGTLVYTGESNPKQTTIKSLLYNTDEIQEKNEIYKFPANSNFKHWLEIFGVYDSKLIQNIGNEFQIHSLILEDIMEISNRVKIEYYDNGIFCIFQLLKNDQEENRIKSEQISIFFSDTLLITFQEDIDDSFAIIRKRMNIENSRIRSRKCDYLFYALVDYVVDCYFILSESFDEEISSIEERVHQGLDQELVVDIYSIRTKLIKFRNFIYPLREEISKIKKMESKFIHGETLIYFRDLEDHLIHLIEISDGQRELLNGIKDLTYSQSSLKLNQDIKWLTVLSTISIPIVLLTGIYGMNFKYMPEIEWKYGYLGWWILTVTIIFSLFVLFKRKKLF